LEVLPEDSDGAWRELTATDELVEFYDPTDIFGDLADALAEAFPSIAPEFPEGAEGAAAEPEAGAEGAEPVDAADAPVAEATTVGDDETDDTASGNGRA
jgi:hypothetical protein